ncbi:amidase [Mycobacterium vicinigordonae]|uniref:amidase n=1 Tax=Mycobacterium vicinigordonae TaxID=1719132 RepID=A0A7D6I7Y6_9MYCO|nr:amidase [Mycobacterium vicinigordonae]QLL09198.1 amidase [Mycobacterium vicinigordonae]
MARVHAFGDDALRDLDGVALAEAIRAGELDQSAVVKAAIARAEAVDPELNALAHPAFDRALAAGRSSGFFAGVPTVIKDNVDVAGQPTMSGTDAWQPYPARADSEVTRVVLGSGLVSLGKTRLSEFGFSAAAEHPRLGPVRNPWNTDHTAGASSSGSAAFVAAGVVPIAHANDGGGSIRIPAACNGLVGLKPSRGRMPLEAALRRMPVNIVANGVVTRSVRDTAAFYREAERTFRAAKLPPIGDVTRAGVRRLKIAVTTQSMHRDCSPELRELTRSTATLLEELGHRVEPIDRIPATASFHADFVLYWGFLALAQVSAGRRMFGETFDRTRLDALTMGLHDHTRRNIHRLPLAIARLRRLRGRSAEFYRSYDALLTPTLADPTPRVGYLAPTDYQQVIDRLSDWVAYTPLQNVTGDPAISLPLAQSSEGLPVGMMLSADLGQEALLLELAYELEEARPWAQIHT